MNLQELLQLGESYHQEFKDAIAETTNCSVEFKIDEHWFSTIFYRNKANNINSDIRSNQIVKLLLKDNTLSATKIAAILNISSRGIEKQLARLKQDNVIIRQGSKKYGTWLVNTKKVLNDE